MLEVDPALAQAIARSTGAVRLSVQSPEGATAQQGLQRVRRALFQIPHPEEPEDPLPSYASAVELDAHGAHLTFDIADAEAYPGLIEQVVSVIVEALEAEGVEGVVTASP